MIGNITKKRMNYIMKQLIASNQTDDFFPTALIDELNSDKALYDNAGYLENLGYLKLQFADNKIFNVYITSDGDSYFFTKRQNILKTLAHWTINLTVAILSAVAGSAITLIIQQALIK